MGTKATIIGNHGGTTPGDTDCDFRLTTTVNPASSGEPSDVDIAVQGYDRSSPDEYQSNRSEQRTDAAGHPGAFSDHPRLPGGSSCFFDGSMLNCARGDYLFTIGGTGDAASQSDPSWVTRALLPVAVKVGSELQ